MALLHDPGTEPQPKSVPLGEQVRPVPKGRAVRGESSPKEPAPEAPCEHRARPVTERGPRGSLMDAPTLHAREQAVTGAVSQAMLAVMSLRHLTPRQRTGPSHRPRLLNKIQRGSVSPAERLILQQGGQASARKHAPLPACPFPRLPQPSVGQKCGSSRACP